MCFGHKYLICETTFKNSFSDLFYLKETYFCKKKKVVMRIYIKI